MAFRGNYEHSLDAKNRLTIPSKLRQELGGQVVIGQSLEDCVAIWTPEGFDSYTAAFLDGLHPLSDEARDLTAYFSGNSFDSELDKAGRAMIPGNLLRHAAIDGDVVVVGAHDHLQLWSPENWAQRSTGVAANLKSTVAKIVSAG
ncbi:MAG: division/cell wall cluster transcriptional repressor MraZ [Thermoleophilaceae bacterium]|nr:division/cell wall cluster transcriptional repressor MraZ [Thermoleophilaceae bacterium]